MRTLMKTQVPPQPNHDYRNTVVGFRITQDEQTKLKSIQRTMRTRGIRGTTSKEIVQMAKDAGANKVFFTSAAPPVRFPHVYGINMPNRDELIAYDRTINEIAEKLDIDNLVYQSVENLRKSIISDSPIEELEMSCFTGSYVTGTVNQEYLDWVENEYKS